MAAWPRPSEAAELADMALGNGEIGLFMIAGFILGGIGAGLLLLLRGFHKRAAG
jgi:hypothetical protein